MKNLTALKLLQFLQVLQKANQENPHPKTFTFILIKLKPKMKKKFTKTLKYFSVMQIKVVVIRWETVQLWKSWG